jgi:Fe2+ or Zn2+ uptake regulation protein
MFIIFGWGHQTIKQYGATLPIKCPNCNNSVFLHLVQTRTWFTLFFIPVIPYESKHYLLCEICGQGIELNGEEIDRAKELNQATSSFLSKEISEDQYKVALYETRLLEQGA